MKIIIVGEVSLLVGVDVNIVHDLLTACQSREGNSARLVGGKVKFVGNQNRAALRLTGLNGAYGINRDDHVHTLNRSGIRSLDVKEIIVGFQSAVRHLVNHSVGGNIALAPGRVALVWAPITALTVLKLVVGGKTLAGVVVDLLGGSGNKFGNKVNRIKVRTVAERS